MRRFFSFFLSHFLTVRYKQHLLELSVLRRDSVFSMEAECNVRSWSFKQNLLVFLKGQQLFSRGRLIHTQQVELS